MLEKLRHDKRGITGLVLATVVALIVITIVVPIGIIITYNLSTVVSGLGLPANSAAANASNQVFTTAWQAYNLAAIMSIVAAAGAIITIIIVAFARFSGRGGV
jgi:hypothetical protein